MSLLRHIFTLPPQRRRDAFRYAAMYCHTLAAAPAAMPFSLPLFAITAAADARLMLPPIFAGCLMLPPLMQLRLLLFSMLLRAMLLPRH